MLYQLDPHSKDPRAPKKKTRHLGWRILRYVQLALFSSSRSSGNIKLTFSPCSSLYRVWWKTFIFKCILSVLYVLLEFAAPLGVNRLLTYLEEEGKGAILKPWVYIAAIGVGPLAQGITFSESSFSLSPRSILLRSEADLPALRPPRKTSSSTSVLVLCAEPNPSSLRSCLNTVSLFPPPSSRDPAFISLTRLPSFVPPALRIQLREDPTAKKEGEDGEPAKAGGNL